MKRSIGFLAAAGISTLALIPLGASARADQPRAPLVDVSDRVDQPQAPLAALRAAKLTKKAARRFRKLRVEGDELAQNTAKLTSELHWHDDLAAAREESRQSGKPVLWIQALGELDGFL